MAESDGLRVREYGDSGPTVIVLHGGPAAPGSAAPIARGLAETFRVLEPWQRASGDEPLTVARHVADLRDVVREHCGDGQPALVGESWGAMLALAYAAEHPRAAGPLALVGCGTFDPEARARMERTLSARMSEETRRRMEQIEQELDDPGERLRRKYEVIRPLQDYDVVEPEERDAHTGSFDVPAHTETWADMLRLQEEGVYPAAFSAIESPVLMLHGAYDPHPGPMIRDGLRRYIPQLEYREWERCGHRPWAERAVRGEFFAVLREWLRRHTEG
ncbi:MAG: alpha/beta hydrolase [Candidatus Brocadiia bacterium]